jgi:hypothetical protein
MHGNFPPVSHRAMHIAVSCGSPLHHPLHISCGSPLHLAPVGGAHLSCLHRNNSYPRHRDARYPPCSGIELATVTATALGSLTRHSACICCVLAFVCCDCGQFLCAFPPGLMQACYCACVLLATGHVYVHGVCLPRTIEHSLTRSRSHTQAHTHTHARARAHGKCARSNRRRQRQ